MGLIKPHLVIAEPFGQPHIGLGKDGRPAHQRITRGDKPCLN